MFEVVTHRYSYALVSFSVLFPLSTQARCIFSSNIQEERFEGKESRGKKRRVRQNECRSNLARNPKFSRLHDEVYGWKPPKALCQIEFPPFLSAWLCLDTNKPTPYALRRGQIERGRGRERGRERAKTSHSAAATRHRDSVPTPAVWAAALCTIRFDLRSPLHRLAMHTRLGFCVFDRVQRKPVIAAGC